jgi:hypothetical protein
MGAFSLTFAVRAGALDAAGDPPGRPDEEASTPRGGGGSAHFRTYAFTSVATPSAGPCSLTVSKPELKARLLLAFETKM